MIYNFLLTVHLEHQYRHFRLSANSLTLFYFYLVTVDKRASQVDLPWASYQQVWPCMHPRLGTPALKKLESTWSE